MAGSLIGSTPWSRGGVRALTPEHLAELEAAIPDGHFVTLACGSNRGDWSAYLMSEGPRPQLIAGVRHKPTLAAAVWAALHEGKVAA